MDIVVVGGGPVGAALALELHAAGMRVTILEARASPAPPLALRPLALSHGSRMILERLGVWDAIAPATPIERIHVSQRGRFGRTVLSAAEAAMPALGYVTDYGSLVKAFDAALAQRGVEIRRGAEVTTIAHDVSCARVEFTTPDGVAECYASLVAIADGSAHVGDVDVRTTDYGQSAVTALVETDAPHAHTAHTAYERFTPDGPLALLPLARAYALVWTLAPRDAEALVDAPAEAFLERLQACFGERVGRFRAVSARSAHPLALRVAQSVTWGRAVLIGNAAQTLHPVAGQGFNLGLRDAWELAVEARRCGPAGDEVLESYRARRNIDRSRGVAFTDTLIRIFSNDFFPLAVARGAGLMLLDCLPPARDFVVRRMVFGARG